MSVSTLKHPEKLNQPNTYVESADSSSSSPLVMIPRRYQEEIFLRAISNNVIAAMDTGSGKTLISVLLIKWMATNETKKKVILFFAPTVALAVQQGHILTTQTHLRVKTLYGSIVTDMGDRDKWMQVFSEHDVIVMTPQIFVDILTHTHWSIRKVSLIIFDECHRATKNHPYVVIMREYKLTNSSERPRIFGMTASPIWNIKSPEESLKGLESTLDAKIISVKYHTDELIRNVQKPTETVERFPSSTKIYGYPSPPLFRILDFMDFDPDPLLLEKIRHKYSATWTNLGPYAAELYLYKQLRMRLDQLKREFLDTTVNSATGTVFDRNSISPEITLAEDVLDSFSGYLNEDSLETIPDDWYSFKVSCLVNIIVKHPKPFQGIVFVEQRQDAIYLASIIQHILSLRDEVRCSYLVGNGEEDFQSPSMTMKQQSEVLKAFRGGDINLIIATSVGEEGLDFPKCDLVVRFDPLQNLVGYIQSRGRARNSKSHFVLMYSDDDEDGVACYREFVQCEPALKHVYQTRSLARDQVDSDNTDTEDEDMLHPQDELERERFVVPSTGAILTYDSAIPLLARLCALIPRQPHTPIPKPTYSGDFQSTLRLPSSISIRPQNESMIGPVKRSKREAKRAVAFHAVKKLYHLKVFDEYLLPVSADRSPNHIISENDMEARTLSKIPAMMSLDVCDPFKTYVTLDYQHTIFIGNNAIANLITGRRFPSFAFFLPGDDISVRISAGKKLELDYVNTNEHRKLIDEYTRRNIWYICTGRKIEPAFDLSAFLVPVASRTSDSAHLDIEGIARSLEPRELPCASDTNALNLNLHHDLIETIYERGRTFVITQIRQDLTPSSKTIVGSRYNRFGHETYGLYFGHRWSRNPKLPPYTPTAFPLVEARRFIKQSSARYGLKKLRASSFSTADPDRRPFNSRFLNLDEEPFLMPLETCRQILLTEEVYTAYAIFPKIVYRARDVWRAREARFQLGLPAINDNLLTEALTIPSVGTSYNNQRLETLGDSVLKLCVTVFLLNEYPFCHEGQLSILRTHEISNRHLRYLAKRIGLERFITGEAQSFSIWPCVIDESPRHITIPRRSLQDCMEALLGAAYVYGGVYMALSTGTALGLCFGGSVPWPARYFNNRSESQRVTNMVSSPLFDDLQAKLGYDFQDNTILVEALTHSSLSLSKSYERLELLGDACIDLMVLDYLHDKYPKANSGDLTLAKIRLIRASTLAVVAVQHLKLHQLILVNSYDLNAAIEEYTPLLEEIRPHEIISDGWKHEPPKALSDVVESLIGAVLVDSRWNWEKTRCVAENIMRDMLDAVSLDLPNDPTTEFYLWAAKSKCKKIRYNKTKVGDSRHHEVSISVHETIVAGPIVGPSLAVIKGFVAQKALNTLLDPTSDKSLIHLCLCSSAVEVEKPERNDTLEEPNLSAPASELVDDTHEGFTSIAQTWRSKFETEAPLVNEKPNPERELHVLRVDGEDELIDSQL